MMASLINLNRDMGKNSVDYIENAINGIFLFIIIVLGNYLITTFSCETQGLLTNNIYAKHIIIIVILYFAIDLPNNITPYHPLITLLITLFIYSLYILFTKMNIEVTLLVFGLLSFTYVIDRYINYYEKNDYSNVDLNRLLVFRKILSGLIVFCILLGASYAYLGKKNRGSLSHFLLYFGRCKVNPK